LTHPDSGLSPDACYCLAFDPLDEGDLNNLFGYDSDDDDLSDTSSECDTISEHDGSDTDTEGGSSDSDNDPYGDLPDLQSVSDAAPEAAEEPSVPDE
jgi:hypothetical protein